MLNLNGHDFTGGLELCFVHLSKAGHAERPFIEIRENLQRLKIERKLKMFQWLITRLSIRLILFISHFFWRLNVKRATTIPIYFNHIETGTDESRGKQVDSFREFVQIAACQVSHLNFEIVSNDFVDISKSHLRRIRSQRLHRLDIFFRKQIILQW